MVRAKPNESIQNESTQDIKSGNKKTANSRKSLAIPNQKIKDESLIEKETKVLGRKSLPPMNNAKVEEDSDATDDDSVDSIAKLNLQYTKLQSNMTLSCADLPTSAMCEECGFTNGILTECQGSCERSFHLECLGQTDEVEPLAEQHLNKQDYICDECQNERHECFACKLSYTDDPNQVTKKCSIATCGKYYHEKCMKSSELFRKDSSSTANKPAYICPQHACNTCWLESKTNNTSGLDHTRGRFIKCMLCPIAYHQSELCLAAGSKILNSSQIICPLHFKQVKSSTHHTNIVNVNWCFVCCETGELLGCTRCPSAYHKSCLKTNDARYMNKNMNDEDSQPKKKANQEDSKTNEKQSVDSINKENWLCEDCIINKRPLYGEIVWAKVGNYRWWPAQICLPRLLENPTVRSIQCLVGEFVVNFFGTFDYYSINLGRCFTFNEADGGGSTSRGSLSHSSGGNTLMRAFTDAVHQAKLAFKEVERVRASRAPKTPVNKHNFQMIKTNRPYGRVATQKLQLQEIPRCDCSPNEVAPCGDDSTCMNRMLKYECHPLVCPAGPRCLNQRFVKREYPKQETVGAGDRGWGLRALVDIKKGDFVNEYVGEIIDDDECKRRMEQAHLNKITNFYFLTIDKDRVIDAGPKGNLARFANHSCEPNMETQKWVVNGDVRVGLFACKDISAGSELTFNYQLDCLSNQKAVCKCGSKNCAGFIGDRPKPVQAQSSSVSLNGATNGGGNNNRKRKISEVTETMVSNSTSELNIKKSRNTPASMSRVRSQSQIVIGN